MTGRDLIDYIYKNGLEDEEVITRNSIIGYISEDEAAVKFGVGVSTIRVWVNQERVKGLNMNGVVYIPYNAEDPRTTDVGLVDVVKNAAEKKYKNVKEINA